MNILQSEFDVMCFYCLSLNCLISLIKFSFAFASKAVSHPYFFEWNFTWQKQPCSRWNFGNPALCLWHQFFIKSILRCLFFFTTNSLSSFAYIGSSYAYEFCCIVYCNILKTFPQREFSKCPNPHPSRKFLWD